MASDDPRRTIIKGLTLERAAVLVKLVLAAGVILLAGTFLRVPGSGAKPHPQTVNNANEARFEASSAVTGGT